MEDMQAAAAGDAPPHEAYHEITLIVSDCLQNLLEGTKGAALLHFCEQDNDLGALRKLTVPEATVLHPVAASLLWHGLVSPEVITALVGPSARGLSIFGRLLTSPDIRSRVLAALCVGCVVRGCGDSLDT